MKRGKYSDWTRGQVEALLNIIGEENAKKLLRGEIMPSFKGAVKSLFDRYGRRIPPQGLQAKVCDPDRQFGVGQPELTTEYDYFERLWRLHEYLGMETGFTDNRFMAASQTLLGRIHHNPQVANILNGVWLPVILPKLTEGDTGKALEQYLEAAKRSYVRRFRDRKFYAFYQKESVHSLIGQVEITEGSRHDQLIERMRLVSMVGIYFPTPLQGFSPNAAIEQMASLPEGFVLSGLDAVIAMIMYSDVLAQGSFSVTIDLSALFYTPYNALLYFAVNNTGLDFSTIPDPSVFTRANGTSSSGLLFIG